MGLVKKMAGYLYNSLAESDHLCGRVVTKVNIIKRKNTMPMKEGDAPVITLARGCGERRVTLLHGKQAITCPDLFQKNVEKNPKNTINIFRLRIAVVIEKLSGITTVSGRGNGL